MPTGANTGLGMGGFSPAVGLATGFFKQVNTINDENRKRAMDVEDQVAKNIDEGIRMKRQATQQANDLEAQIRQTARQISGNPLDPIAVTAAHTAMTSGLAGPEMLAYANTLYKQATTQNKNVKSQQAAAGVNTDNQPSAPNAPQTGTAATPEALPTASTSSAQNAAPSDQGTPAPAQSNDTSEQPTPPSAPATPDQSGLPIAGQSNGVTAKQNDAQQAAVAPTTSGMTGAAGAAAAPPPATPEAPTGGFKSMYHSSQYGPPADTLHSAVFGQKSQGDIVTNAAARYGMSPDEANSVMQGNYPSGKVFTPPTLPEGVAMPKIDPIDFQHRQAFLKDIATKQASLYHTVGQDAVNAAIKAAQDFNDPDWYQKAAAMVQNVTGEAQAKTDIKNNSPIVQAQTKAALAKAALDSGRLDQLSNGNLTNDMLMAMAEREFTTGERPARNDLRTPMDVKNYQAARQYLKDQYGLSEGDIAANKASFYGYKGALNNISKQESVIGAVNKEIGNTAGLITNQLDEMQERGKLYNWTPATNVRNYISANIKNDPDVIKLNNYLLAIQQEHAKLESLPGSGTSTNQKLNRAWESINNSMSPEGLRAALDTYHQEAAQFEQAYTDQHKDLTGKIISLTPKGVQVKDKSSDTQPKSNNPSSSTVFDGPPPTLKSDDFIKQFGAAPSNAVPLPPKGQAKVGETYVTPDGRWGVWNGSTLATPPVGK